MMDTLPIVPDPLEQRIQERTAELVRANELLRRELEEHKRAELALLEELARRKKVEEELRGSSAETGLVTEGMPAGNNFLSRQVKVDRTQSMIIGESKCMKEVLHLVKQVAPTPSSVLVVGETGTGKELIAETIHQLSVRKHLPMVKVNCAALPSALIESELFGRERGAYTGALTRQAGRFEAADKSTIFLDEVGELSPEVQAKLLRVLQEGWFERLGNPKPIKVDVRVVAATNRDLAAEMRKGRFREDLYYRLDVFPIKVPPLRERPEDVPMLVWAFIEEFCSRMGKKITKVPQKTMELLQRHSWPGNVRELRNIMEHSVIISRGEILRIPALQDSAQAATEIRTLEETEREHILRTLEITRWRIKGPGGAAERLGMKPSTLYSRMEKLGIPTRRQKDQNSQ
jgi:transcriptional regulator with GAF, ATPase, and Fis domain